MRTASLLAYPLLLAASTSAFRDTSPLLIWSSAPNEQLSDASSEISSGVVNAQDVYATMSSLGCDWDRMVVVNVDGLHQTHLPSLSVPSSPSLYIPYLVRPDPASFETAIRDWASVCNADMSGSANSGKAMETLSANKDDDLESILISLPYSPDLVILHGTASSPSPPSHPEKRQERPFPSHATSSGTSSAAHATSTGNSSTIPPKNAPLLERAQFFTTPIITALLVIFLVLLPLLGMGVSALAGIQVPPRMMEIGKGMQVGKEKKDQ